MQSWLKKQTARRMLVTTVDADVTITGTLLTSSSDGVVLVACVIAGVDAQGEIYIPREKIRFIQVIS